MTIVSSLVSSLVWSSKAPSNISGSLHNWTQRAYFVCMHFINCLVFGLFPLIAMTSFLLYKPPPSVSLDVNHIRIGKGIEDPFMNRLTNLVEFNLSLDADFSRLFHWNTKQLFLYLVLEYETPNYERNQIVVWDRIVRRTGDNHRISINKLKNKYAVNDINDLLQGRNAVLKLYWNTVPWVGLLYDTQNGSVFVKIPEYVQ